MRFRKLTIENYKSFQFATEIIFPVGEDGRSIFLIGGMNGAGKTAVMEAINYCLYGAKTDEGPRQMRFSATSTAAKRPKGTPTSHLNWSWIWMISPNWW